MKQTEASDEDCESIRQYTITALSSGPNAKFSMFIDRLDDATESQTGANKAMDWHNIIDTARVKDNNMTSLSQQDTVDPHDAKLLALVTQVKTLKSNQGTNGRSWKGEDAGNKEKISGVAKWRTIKNKGESNERSGTTWYWCTKHKHPNGAVMVSAAPTSLKIAMSGKRAGIHGKKTTIRINLLRTLLQPRPRLSLLARSSRWFSAPSSCCLTRIPRKSAMSARDTSGHVPGSKA